MVIPNTAYNLYSECSFCWDVRLGIMLKDYNFSFSYVASSEKELYKTEEKLGI